MSILDRAPATELRLVIRFTEPVFTEPLTDGLGEWMRELEAGDGFAKLGIADWRFETTSEEADGCAFEHPNPHEWYCTTHETLLVAGTSEPVSCPVGEGAPVLEAGWTQ